MSEAYKCDSCGEYEDVHPDEAPTLTAPDNARERRWAERAWYDLCRECAVKLEGLVVRSELEDLEFDERSDTQ